MSGEALRRIVAALEACGIPFMLAGSFASTHHGVPRTTHDIDLVIDPSREGLRALVQHLLAAEFYVSEAAVEEAWRRRGAFNAVDLRSGWKTDLILCRQRPFSREEFARRQPAQVLGIPLSVATAEDTILAKLEWARASGSERQLRDVAGILSLQAGRLDEAYLARWAAELGVDELLRRARDKARAG